MGVPNYFQTIIDNYPDVLLTKLSNVALLYFDFNGIVHWAAGKVATEMKYQSKHHDGYERAILLKIDERVKQLHDLVQPHMRIGFFVDGPAVKAKMKQQLQRRTKGPIEHAMKESIRKQLGEELDGDIYNKNAITPGTQFMTKLNDHLLKLAAQYPKLDVIISNSNEPGEGEHKMFNHIKSEQLKLHIDKENPDKSQKIVIVGLDADLIMLSLVSHLDNIYLMRESTQRDVKDADNIFHYLEVGLFRLLLITEIRNKITNIDKETLYHKSEEDAIINDYIFMCFLLGNDFVPHSPALSIKSGGIDRLITRYVSVFNETKEHLVTIKKDPKTNQIKTKVNLKPITKLINILADEEDEEMKIVYKRRQKLERYPIRNRTPKATALDDEMHKLHYLSAFKVADELELQIDGYFGWQTKYFKHVLKLERNDENKDSICRNYLEGLDWVLQYYYTETHSWGWMYRFISAPLFQDLADYLNRCTQFPVEPAKTMRMGPYTPFCQLMMVVPKTSATLLPKELGKFMTDNESPLAHYYPNKFKLNFLFHIYLWEAEPYLPMIDEKKVELVVDRANLTKDEKKRNSFDKMIIIPRKK